MMVPGHGERGSPKIDTWLPPVVSSDIDIMYVVQIGEIQNAFLMYFCYLRYGFGAYFKQVITYSDAALREKCATPILKQVIINHL